MSLDKKTSSVPVNGINEIQRITIGGTGLGGSFVLKFGSRATAAINWSATNGTLLANIQTALDAMFGSGNTLAAVASLTAGIGTIDVTFKAALGVMLQPFVMTVVSSLTGTSPTISIAQNTAGVNATNRSAAPGERLIYTGVTPPVTYENASGTAFNPTWVIRDTANVIVSAATDTIAVPKQGVGTVIVTYNVGAGAYTLTPPTAGSDDGKLLRVVSTTNKAHVLTCSDGFNAKGSSGTATLGAAIGNGVTLCAYNGHWYATSNINATLA